MCTTDSPNNKFFTYSDVFKVCMCEDVIVECIPDENWETYAYNGVSFDLLGLALRARLTTPLSPPLVLPAHTGCLPVPPRVKRAAQAKPRIGPPEHDGKCDGGVCGGGHGCLPRYCYNYYLLHA